jgi:hypothetical protein
VAWSKQCAAIARRRSIESVFTREVGLMLKMKVSVDKVRWGASSQPSEITGP